MVNLNSMNGDLINVSIIRYIEYNYFTNRAMRILLFVTLFLFQYGCTTVEVAKEVTKATKSIKTSVTNMLNIENKNQDKLKNNKSVNDDDSELLTNDNKIIEKELANLKREKKEKKEIIQEQKKKTKINFIGKTSNEIQLMIGLADLIRVDGNTKIIRFDNSFCQLFLFSNLKIKDTKIEYFEIRNKSGKLIINKNNIKNCYKEFKLL